MQHKILLLLFGLTIQISIAQKDVTVPEAINFNTGIGSESSVNQSNGKLSIPISLVSLDGYKDLSAKFGIFYDGSNVNRSALSINEHAPTSILGLGWGFAFPRILADNKLTAARDDDQYYVFENGALIELIGFEKTNNPLRYSFSLKQHKAWKVSFYPDQEKWEIIKENGYKYTYGNVNWSVYWNNWIGNNNVVGAERQGSSWNLTSVEDMHGNSIFYEYENVEQPLLNNAFTKHTEATYLKKIIGPNNEEIRLVYGDKIHIEYHEPNTKKSEPDAYQENYEKKFLEFVEVYDSNQQFLYKYRFDYDFLITGDGRFRKRLLDKITLINSQNESQLFREFDYDTDLNSDFYGNLLHQVLPSRGRISYQYSVNEIEVDQVFNDSGTSDSKYIVGNNYIIKTGSGKIFTWNGTTWEQQSLSFGLNEVQLVYRNNFIVALWKQGSVYKSRAYGLKDDGYTWELSPYGTQTHVTAPGKPRLMAGNDFYAIGYSRHDKLYMYRWDGRNWHANHQVTSNTGRYFYNATNNFVLKNKRGVLDYLTIYKYNLINEVESNTFDLGFGTSGSVCATDPNNCPDNYWYVQNSFAQANVNGNPEYLITWDKNYNFYNKYAPFGQVIDEVPVFGSRNNYFGTLLPGTSSTKDYMYLNRYHGNGQWKNKTIWVEDSQFSPFPPYAIGEDSFIRAQLINSGTSSESRTGVFIYNANIADWIEYNPYQTVSTGTGVYDYFGKNLMFAHSKVYKINNDLTISNVGNITLSNFLFAKSDGANIIYLQPLLTSNPDISKVIIYDNDGSVSLHNLPADYYLNVNVNYNNTSNQKLPRHSIGNGVFVLTNQNNSNQYKLFKTIKNTLDVNYTTGKGIYKDIVVAKEVFDPVLTRKQRTYYCYSNPKISNDNMRVYYSQVSQQNDLDGVLGKTVTFYDAGTDDVRKTGLPNKVQIYDAQNNLVSEQKNTWRINQLGESYYINLDKKFTRSIENTQEIVSTTFYEYDLQTGLQKKIRVVDSEGNEEVNTNYYLFEEYPQIADTYNLLSPVIVNKSYFTQEKSNQKEYKSVTAVKWSTTGIPEPKISYYWNGANSSSEIGFNFSGSNPDFLISQNLSKYDTSGNLLEEKNRSSVITSYIYGYDNKRIVAKVEGATHNQAIGFVSQSILNNPSSDAQLRTELQKIRDGVPNAFVSSYTYNPSIGLTSMTDPRGRTQYYHYDSFYRLDYIVNNDNEIVSRTNYNYREAPFNYEPESTQLPDCELINTQISNDPSNTDPLTLSISVLGTATNQSVSFKAMASDGGVYNYNWNYQFTNPSDESYFDIDINDNVISFSNNFCSDGTFTVWAEIQGYTPLITSNNLGHTFTSTNTDPNAIDCFEN